MESYLVPRSRRLTWMESYLVPRCRRPAGRGSTSMGAVTASTLRLPPHGFLTRGGLARFARELVPNGVAYGFPNFGSRALFLLKKSPHPCKNWSFVWKIENRPTYCDFEIYNLHPDLHQIFKPIRKLLCTFLLIYSFKLRTPLKHMKVSKKLKDQNPITFTFSLHDQLVGGRHRWGL